MMKYRRSIPFIIILLTLLLSIPSYAANHVTDTVGLLTSTEIDELSVQAQIISEKHDFGIYFMTIDDFRDYTDSNDIFDAATALYKQHNMGMGDERKGLLLLLSMSERDFSLITYSDLGNFIFDNGTREEVVDCFLDNFASNDWYGGFSDYIEASDTALEDTSGRLRMAIALRIGIILLVPLLIAAAITFVLGLKMESVIDVAEANAYVSGGLILTNSLDQYSHTTQTRTKIEDNDSDSGSSRSSSSGGFSGTSGKF